ncbi:MAG: hypothetical protein WEB62_10550 [Bacteroidota bacterium]
MTPRKLVVDTDILVEHVIHDGSLTAGGAPSILRKTLSLFFCYTTVFNVIEAFSLCRSEEEIEAVESSMHALKILGLNGKSGKRIGLARRSVRTVRDLDLLIAGLCLESKLPLLTGRPKRYVGLADLRVVPSLAVKKWDTAEEILRAVR